MVNLKEIEEKKNTLKKTEEHLKSYFVGIDKVIDKIMHNIRVWYLMPDLLRRPVIINLWGLTGVGKTDLVRKLVKCLNFSDKFCEMELTNNGVSTDVWHRSVAAMLQNSNNIEPEKPGILLLDELQRFRTIDEKGKELLDVKFQDVWTLLSDGKLPHDANLNMILSTLWDSKKPKKQKTQETSNSNIPVEEDTSLSFYTISYVKKALKLKNSLEEMNTWDENKLVSVIMTTIESQEMFEHDDYSKLLIFISGNLDEVYTFAGATDDVEIDPDIFYKQSLKINMLDIKKALKERFKPEQIARLGNVHIPYPSINKKSYKKIIYKKIQEIINNVYTKYNIDLTIDSNVEKLVYENGVFPAQGTRPVFSTISEIVDANISKFLLDAIIKGKNKIKVYYGKGKHNEKNCIKADIEGTNYEFPFEGNLDTIRDKQNKNFDLKAQVSTHEAGHALVYAVLLGKAPSQIVNVARSSSYYGFIGEHETCESHDFLIKKLIILLAGRQAESLVFGEKFVTSGGRGDIIRATQTATEMVRSYGFGESLSKITAITNPDASMLNTNIEDSNKDIEVLLKNIESRSRSFIKQNIKLLKDIIKELMITTYLMPEKFKEICARNALIVEVIDSGDILYHDYYKKLNAFLED